MDDLVVKNEDDYVERAVELAADVSALASLRSNLREKMLNAHLCDGPNFVKGLEQQYRHLWYRYCEGDVPSETRKMKAELEVCGDVAVVKESSPVAAPVTPTSTLATTEADTRTKSQKRSPSPLET